MRKAGIGLLLTVALGGAVCDARAQFWDQGFEQPVFRSDFPDPQTGTAADPLQIDTSCLFTPNPKVDGAYAMPWGGEQYVTDSCPGFLLGQSLAFVNSHWFELNGGGSAENFWTVHFNVEDWWTLMGDSGGPPGQSMPKGSPGFDVLGFRVLALPEEGFYRAHMVLRPDYLERADIVPDGITPADSEASPFMSMGAEAGAGNGGFLGSIGHWYFSHHARIEFVSKLWNVVSPDEFFNHFVFFRTAWYSPALDRHVPRMAFVALYGSDHAGARWQPCDQPICTEMGPTNVWSWPIPESYFHPGADNAFTNVETLAANCPGAVLGHDRMLRWGPGASGWPDSPRDERTYRFNIDRAFECLSDAGGFIDPMPDNSVMPILGVHWGSEYGGTAAGEATARLWTSVHGMRLY